MTDLLELHVGDALPLKVAAETVRGTAVEVGLSADSAGRLGKLAADLVTAARAREGFAATPDAIVIRVRLEGGLVNLAVADTRMPATAAQRRAAQSVGAELAAAGLILTCTTDRGNRVEATLPLPADTAWLGAEEPAAADRVAADVAAATLRRPATAADAEGIVQLVFRCYGYTYFDDTLYSPDAIVRLLEAGTMDSQVAVAPDGRIVGHEALVYEPGNRIPESCRTVVDPSYRGHEIAEHLVADVLERAGNAGVPGVWGECVANHRASQRMALSLSGVETGLLLGVVPSVMKFAGFDNPLAGRMSLVPVFMPVLPTQFGPTYLPDHLIEVYLETMAALGAEREVRDTDQPADGAVVISSSVNHSFGTGRVVIVRSGTDGVERTQDELAAMPADLGAVYLDVALADPVAPRIIRIAEEHGFFWGALIPASREDGDVLRLQRLGSSPVDTAGIRCASAHGERMRDFVLAERARVTS